uniref:ARMC9 CTLH-like domain-containing protein n=1 Tax=Oncorhynchus tshawytscha TaxID=74940 RepID=A0A8C8GPW5_ONCTS
MQFEKVIERWGQLSKRTDEHVREHLIYRGFTSTRKHLNSDMKADKANGFRIVDRLQLFIHNFDLNGLKDYWGYLEQRLFCRLEDIYRPTVTKLQTSLFRYYVVYGVQLKNHEKTQELSQRQAQELQGQSEWRVIGSSCRLSPVPEQNQSSRHTSAISGLTPSWSGTFLV